MYQILVVTMKRTSEILSKSMLYLKETPYLKQKTVCRLSKCAGNTPTITTSSSWTS